MNEDFDALKLNNQLCFPLYACSKEIIRKYTPFLEEIDLTYTQYITMMVLWEHKRISEKNLGGILFLDSGTLTPVLKKLEQKNFITRSRSHSDERLLEVEITQNGEELKEKAATIPQRMLSCMSISKEKAAELYKLLHELLDNLKKDESWKKAQLE